MGHIHNPITNGSHIGGIDICAIFDQDLNRMQMVTEIVMVQLRVLKAGDMQWQYPSVIGNVQIGAVLQEDTSALALS